MQNISCVSIPSDNPGSFFEIIEDDNKDNLFNLSNFIPTELPQLLGVRVVQCLVVSDLIVLRFQTGHVGLFHFTTLDVVSRKKQGIKTRSNSPKRMAHPRVNLSSLLRSHNSVQVVPGASGRRDMEVPEDLVSLTQNILQRPRNEIIRELRMTNLDVNMAINNILSREGDTVAPPFLMRSSRLSDDDGYLDFFPRISSSQLRGLADLNSLRNSERRQRITKPAKTEDSLTTKLVFSEVIVFVESEYESHFIDMAAMYSALYLVGSQSKKLFMLQWSSSSMNCVPFDRTSPLGLEGEEITMLSASHTRASCVTASGKIASWMDDCFSGCAEYAEHVANSFPQLEGERITNICCSPSQTFVLTESKHLYWWGVKQLGNALIEKIIEPSAKDVDAKIVVGSRVYSKNMSLFLEGAIVFSPSLDYSAPPKVGFVLDKFCPTSGTVTVRSLNYSEVNTVIESPKHCGKKRPYSNNAADSEIMSLDLSSIYVLKSSPVHSYFTVVMIYNGMALVRLGNDTSSTEYDQILKLSDLELVPCMRSYKKLLSPIQKFPVISKFTSCTDIYSVLHVENQLHILANFDGKPHYATFKDNNLVKYSLETFMNPCVESLELVSCSKDMPVVMRDDRDGSLRFMPTTPTTSANFPNYVRMGATDCVGVGSRNTESSNNTVIIFVQKESNVLRIINESNHALLLQIINNIENDSELRIKFIDEIINERHDGNRNIMHVAVLLCKTRPKNESENNDEADKFTQRKSPIQEVGCSTKIDETNSSNMDDSLLVLEILCSCSLIRETVITLLSQCDYKGFTPLFSALIEFCYEAALVIINNFKTDETLLRDIFLFCTSASPLHVICQNDLCTYHWTSSFSADQIIYECRTCGILKKYCLCANCALICHRGHDYSISKDYVAGFCDCQFNCKCRALDVGSQKCRMEVFKQLLNIDGVVDILDPKGQHILLYAITALGKNGQKDIRPDDESSRRKNARIAGFVEKALNLLIFDKKVLQSFVTCHERIPQSNLTHQKECASIDKFCFNFIFKTTKISVDEFAEILKGIPEYCQSRYIRSFVRMYTLICPHTIFKASYKMDICQAAFSRIQTMFGNIPVVSSKELISAGNFLITPVLVGVSVSDTLSISEFKDEKTLLDRLENIFNDNLSSSRIILTEARSGSRDDGDNPDAPSNINICRTNDVEQIISQGESDEMICESGDEVNSELRLDDIISHLDHYDEENDSGEFDDEPTNLVDISQTSVGSHLDGDDIEIVEINSDDEARMHDSEEEMSDWSSSTSVDMDMGMHNVDGLVPENLAWAVEPDLTSSTRENISDSYIKHNTAVYYSYIYSIILFDVVQLMCITNINTPGESSHLEEFLCNNIEVLWSKVINVFESLEARIRFGVEMWENNHTTTETPKENTCDSLKDTFVRMLQLLRSQSNEHYGLMPKPLNLWAYLHYAYFFDSISYFYQVMQGTLKCYKQTPYLKFFDGRDSQTNGNTQCYFRRSNSVSSFTNDYNDILESDVSRALPLAVYPQLLTPSATKDVLFGEPNNHNSTVYDDYPTNFAISFVHTSTGQNTRLVAMNISVPSLLKRYHNAVDLFAQLHLDDLDKLPHSNICQFSRFKAKDQRFRNMVAAMPYKNSRFLSFEVERDTKKILIEVFQRLNQLSSKEGYRNRVQPMALSKIDVTFKGEPGRGEGVVRSFFTLLAEAFKSRDRLSHLGLSSLILLPSGRDGRINITTEEIRSTLSMDAEPYVPNSPGIPKVDNLFHQNIYKFIRKKYPTFAPQITGMLIQFPDSQLRKIYSHKDTFSAFAEEAANMLSGNCESVLGFDDSPLFWEPGRPGIYAPLLGKGDKVRLNAFLNVGRIIGLCLFFGRILPIQFCRHVFKYITNREILWHDFAFYNLCLYESLRKLTHLNDDEMNDLCLSFKTSVDINKNMVLVDLKECSDESVTVDNVKEYIRLYSNYCMVKSSEEALKKIRQGVLEVIPADVFDHMSAEDLSLILSGVRSIDLPYLMSITTIVNETGGQNIDTYVAWFWSIFEKMDTSDKHDLLFFWTSSPFIPSSNEGFPTVPSISIRPSEDNRFPTANTCICRLYIPLYSTKSILKSKLLNSIAVKTFGFI